MDSSRRSLRPCIRIQVCVRDKIRDKQSWTSLADRFEGELSGRLYRNPDIANVIVVNSLTARTCQRFTVAHEVGHLLLPPPTLQVDRPISVQFRDERSSLTIDLDEIAANQFAAALLMPRDWVPTDANRLLNRNPTSSDNEVLDCG